MSSRDAVAERVPVGPALAFLLLASCGGSGDVVLGPIGGDPGVSRDVAASTTAPDPGASTPTPSLDPGPAAVTPDPGRPQIADAGSCSLPTEFGPNTLRVTRIAIAESGRAGHGLDIDGDPETCAPAESCDSGVDNQLAELGTLINPAIQDLVDELEQILLIDMPGYRDDGEPFELQVYEGAIPDVCPGDATSCTFAVEAHSFNEACVPNVELRATASAAQLDAGDRSTRVRLPLPIPEQEQLPVLFIDMAQSRLTVTSSAGAPTEVFGHLAGAVDRESALSLVDLFPRAALPADHDTVKTLLAAVFEPDQDTDGDGELDAVSISIALTAVAANIDGLAP